VVRLQTTVALAVNQLLELVVALEAQVRHPRLISS